jgi:putative colanic acid biosynthesis acetyltransferase WcaF
LETNLGNFNNKWYWNSYNKATKVKIVFWYLINMIFINSYLPLPVAFKVWLLRLFGAKIGKNVMIKPKVNIKYPWFLEIGHNTWIGEEVWIDNLDHVIIGENVCISQSAMLLTGNHDFTKTTFDLILDKIVIENGVWICAKAIVCQGVTCKNHSVLGVGAVATTDLDAYGIYKGNPLVFVKNRQIF